MPTRSDPRALEDRLLAVTLGSRLEAAEAGIDETEAALRHLARCTPARDEVWLEQAQHGLAQTRRAIGTAPADAPPNQVEESGASAPARQRGRNRSVER